MNERVEIVDGPIDVAATLRGLPGPPDGAVSLFLGIVRDHNEGRRVLRLEYHAYPEMALKMMRRIAAETRSAASASSVAMVHRIGTLEVGEVSVLVAACAPHRAEAFEACRQAIERVKHEVPIWKKEHFDGGEIWVQGCRTGAPEEGG